MRILVLEDDNATSEIVRLILSQAGFEIDAFSNGDAILSNNYERPDLYLLDIHLRGVDGLEICRHLKTNNHTRAIPVIILSAISNLEKLSLDVCADDYIEKPFDISTLETKIQKFLLK